MNIEDEDTRESQTLRKKSINASKSDYSHFKSNDEESKINRNKFLTNCLNKLQNAYASCQLKPVKLNAEVHEETKILEQQLTNSNINLDDSDIVSCDANSILTPRGMDNIKEFKFCDMDNFLDLSNYAVEEDLSDLNKMEILSPKEIISYEKKLENTSEVMNQNKTRGNGEVKKNIRNPLPKKAAKFQASKKLSTMTKKETISTSSVHKKPSIRLNDSNHKPTTPRLTTPKYSPAVTKSVSIKSTKDKPVIKFQSPRNKKVPIPLSRLSENDEILMEIENIFGENLENFDENLLFNTLEELNTKLLIKALIYLSFEQKKMIKELRDKLNFNSKQTLPNQTNKLTNSKSQSKLPINKVNKPPIKRIPPPLADQNKPKFKLIGSKLSTLQTPTNMSRSKSINSLNTSTENKTSLGFFKTSGKFK